MAKKTKPPTIDSLVMIVRLSDNSFRQVFISKDIMGLFISSLNNLYKDGIPVSEKKLEGIEF